MVRKRWKNLQPVECLDIYESEGEEGFIDGDVSYEDALVVFNFSPEQGPGNKAVPNKVDFHKKID
jgi:hypothetical protein